MSKESQISRDLARIMEDLKMLERDSPNEARSIYMALVAHMRSWKPEIVSMVDLNG